MEPRACEVGDLAPESPQIHPRVLTCGKYVLAYKHVRMTLPVYLQSMAQSGSIMPGLMDMHSSKCFLSCVDCSANIPSGYWNV